MKIVAVYKGPHHLKNHESLLVFICVAANPIKWCKQIDQEMKNQSRQRPTYVCYKLVMKNKI